MHVEHRNNVFQNIQINECTKGMKSKGFMEKVAQLFKLKVGYFTIMYSLPQNQDMLNEIEGDDDEGFLATYGLLPNFFQTESGTQ